MPKKTKKDEILKEIADKLKEIKDEESFDEENEKEKSELEEDVDISALDFNQFIHPMNLEDIRAPILERIAGSQPGPIFVGGMPQTPVTAAGEEEKSDEFKYVPGQEGADEPKYIKSERISREPIHMDLRKVGREQIEIVPQSNQEAFFRRSEPGAQVESPMPERTWGVEQIDTGKEGRENPFEKQETKYEKYKPKTPKSY